MPDPVIPAAPAAPASPPPSPSPAPAPAAPAAAEPVGQSFDNSFPDDGLDTPPEPAKPAGEPAKPSGEPAKPGNEPAKPAAAAPAKPEGVKTEVDFTPPQVAKPNELRTWAQRMGSRAQKAETELAKMQARITQLENQPPRQAEDTANLAKELATAKKRLEEYEGEIRLTKYERSQEYAEQYRKPYEEAVARAYREIRELSIVDEESGTEKPATQADFDEIYQANLGQATRLAKAKFGDAAIIVLQHRQAIRQLAERAYNAVEEYKAKGGERETQTKAQAAQQQAAMQRMFTAAQEGHAKRSPETFNERDGDTEGNTLLGKGKEFAAAVFGGNEGLTPQQIAFRDAMAFNRLAAYPRLVRDVKKLKSELAEAQKTIEGLRGSGPGRPEPGTDKQGEEGYKPFDQAFDEIPG